MPASVYVQKLRQSTHVDAQPAPEPLHVQLRDYLATLPWHRKLRPFYLEQLCDRFDADPAAMTTALKRCGFVRHERHYPDQRWVFWLHWSSPHRF